MNYREPVDQIIEDLLIGGLTPDDAELGDHPRAVALHQTVTRSWRRRGLHLRSVYRRERAKALRKAKGQVPLA